MDIRIQMSINHTNGIVALVSTLIYITSAASAVYGEASSALCLFVCSAIRGQETIQRCEGSDDHLFLSLSLQFSFFLER